jgi:hypothetical protein
MKIRTETIVRLCEEFIQWNKTLNKTNDDSWIKVKRSEYNQRNIIRELTI